MTLLHTLSRQSLRVHTRRSLSTARSTRPVLPPAQTLSLAGNYALNYIDIRPDEPAGGEKKTKKPTVVLIHGAPGSFQDYKHLVPLLQDKARVIGVSLPGNGDSKVLDTANYYERLSAINVHRSAYDALVELCEDDEDVFVVGHSFGGHATINVTAFNEQEKKLNIRGVALLASAGLRPHRAFKPRTNTIMWNLLRSNVSLVEQWAKELVRLLFVKVLRFPNNAPADVYAAGIVRCATTDFNVIRDHVQRIRNVPAFIAWARDDAFMEEEISMELGELCHPGPRFSFEKGGHNIQKTKAPLLADELMQWATSVLSGDVHSHSREITQHP